MTMTNLNKPPRGLLHFHVCVHCGSAFRREAFEGRALTSGVFPCLKCGLEGPLNVEIRESVELETENVDSTSSRNSVLGY
jgi:hypothetical protein